MGRKWALLAVFLFVGMAVAFAQADPAKEEPVQSKPTQEKQSNEKIKNVPAAEAKPKPSKISSGARPGSIRSKQPVQPGKPPVKGKPPGTGKPGGN
jgi:hypothetical protein